MRSHWQITVRGHGPCPDVNALGWGDDSEEGRAFQRTLAEIAVHLQEQGHRVDDAVVVSDCGTLAVTGEAAEGLLSRLEDGKNDPPPPPPPTDEGTAAIGEQTGDVGELGSAAADKDPES